ncbi:hypothetical protein JCM6882_003432 [Rhodosporidiobolus microsporus]
MGDLEIDPESHVLDSSHKPISGLFASGEVAGGVHGANRLGGSSLLVAGDSAASYLLKDLSAVAGGASSAATRLGQVQGHLSPLSTTIQVDPQGQKVNLTISWSGDSASPAPSSGSLSGAGSGGGQGGEVAPKGESTAQQPASEKDMSVKHDEGEKKAEGGKGGKKELRDISMDEVKKHNSKDDCWVVVKGQAVVLYAGRDATEETLTLHDLSPILKYAPDTVIGTLKA